jgi:hypothetical protein
MNQAFVLYPMLALIGWTFLVLLLMARRRIAAVQAGRVHAREFALGESAAVPADCTIVNRHYMNLLEIPLLFYAVSLTYYVTQQADAVALALAWSYVALRLAHSAVHLGSNRLFHRLLAFAFSNFALMGLWGWLLVKLL